MFLTLSSLAKWPVFVLFLPSAWAWRFWCLYWFFSLSKSYNGFWKCWFVAFCLVRWSNRFSTATCLRKPMYESVSTVNINTVLCVSCCTRELLLHVQRRALELPDFQALFAFPGIANTCSLQVLCNHSLISILCSLDATLECTKRVCERPFIRPECNQKVLQELYFTCQVL